MSWVHLNQQGKVNSHLLTHTLETTLEAGIIACKVGNKEDMKFKPATACRRGIS